jgi:hypothetical protein
MPYFSCVSPLQDQRSHLEEVVDRRTLDYGLSLFILNVYNLYGRIM